MTSTTQPLDPNSTDLYKSTFASLLRDDYDKNDDLMFHLQERKWSQRCMLPLHTYIVAKFPY